MAIFKRAAAANAVDLRTSSARALDATVDWLRERIPDRVPSGGDPLYLAHPSWCAAVADELGRRLRDELAGEIGFDSLGKLLEKLPSALLQHNPSEREIARLRDEIDATVEFLRHPPAPRLLPAEWLDLAGELGIKLRTATHHSEDDEVHKEAHDQLRRAINAGMGADPRIFQLTMWFGTADVLAPGERPLDLRRVAHVLAAERMLPAFFTRGAWAASDSELREVSRIAKIGRPVQLLLGFKEVVAAFGARMPDEPRWAGFDAAKLDRELTEIEAKREAGAFVTAAEKARAPWGDLNERRAREAKERAAATARQSSSVFKALVEVYGDSIEALRARIISALDTHIAERPIGAGWWYARRVRAVLAQWEVTRMDEFLGDLHLLQRCGVRLGLV